MRWARVALTTVALAALMVVTAWSAFAAKGGKKPKPPPPPPGEPEIACRYETRKGSCPPSNLSVYDLNGNRTEVANVGVRGCSWSPDGLHITWGGGIKIFCVDVDGTDHTVLYEDDYAEDAAWSPDGETIAFAGDDVANTQSILYLLPAEGGTPQPLYVRPYDVWIESPTWNAAGTHIAFMEGSYSGPWDVRVIEVATGTVSDVIATISSHFIEWARTKDVLLYETGGTVYTLDIATGQSTPVASGGWSSWSPDDTEIVIERSGMLVRHVLATGAETEIGKGRYPNWRR